VADAAGNTATGTTVGASLVGGNPAVATQTSRISALRNILACSDDQGSGPTNNDTDPTPDDGNADEDEKPDWSEHPLRFGLSVAGATQQYHAGLIVGDIAFTLGFTVLVVAVVAPLRLLASKSASYGYGRALAWCRFPGILSVPVALFVPPIAHSAAVCVASFTPDITTASRAIGGLGVLVAVIVPAACLGGFRAFFHRHFAWTVNGVEVDDPVFAKNSAGSTLPAASTASGTDQAAGHGRRGLVTTGDLLTTAVTSRMTAMLLTEDREWLSRDRGKTAFQMRRFGMFFDVYRGRAPWFFVVELGFAVFVSFLTGLHEAFGCSPIAWTAAAGYVLLTATYVVLRPHAASLDRVIYTSLAFTQACASVLVAAVVELSKAKGRDDPATLRTREAGSFFLSAISMSAAAAGLYELFKVVYQQWLVHHRERRRREAAERGQLGDDSADAAALLLLDTGGANDGGGDHDGAPAALGVQDAAHGEEMHAIAVTPFAASCGESAPVAQCHLDRANRPPAGNAAPRAAAQARPTVAADHWLTDSGYVPPGHDSAAAAEVDDELNDDLEAVLVSASGRATIGDDEAAAQQAAHDRLARIRNTLGDASARTATAARAASRISTLAKPPPVAASRDVLDDLLGDSPSALATSTVSSPQVPRREAADIDLDDVLGSATPPPPPGAHGFGDPALDML
jgi:hypothetical protein